MAVRNCKRDGAATVLLQFIAGASIAIFSFLFPFKFPSDIKPFLFFILACLFYALNDRLQTTVRKNLEVSVFSITSQVENVFMITFGFLFFKEPFIFSKIIGAAIILGANIFLFYEKGKFKFNKYVVLSVFANFFLAAGLSLDVNFSQYFNLPLYIMLSLFVPALIIFFAERLKIKEVLNEYNSGDKKYYLATGFCWGILILTYIRAMQLGEITKSVPLYSSYVLINVLISTSFFGETGNRLKKIIASLLVILGIYLTVSNFSF